MNLTDNHIAMEALNSFTQIFGSDPNKLGVDGELNINDVRGAIILLESLSAQDSTFPFSTSHFDKKKYNTNSLRTNSFQFSLSLS